ncbi:hypothetical protein [Burkholderia cenocepacia]|uniref:hypothetical protein n=1 Tax=Burkholderia cenocepacia TaxID=95486 RepID=UPI002019261B|nr:hypothetical protein [Burkholderia cenocepacia]MCO1396403.1 hypothetical protein [Burkholderia cenocepacia]MCO1408977.1 hypothetical protein [Burkholderia cenocepacia]UQN92048.1 hypothetical protein L0Z06_15110 [Burkholderia cenocepacia]UQN99197.1 hypothetical protein L0Z39_16900 [Burkholderia cenocepacia]UQP50848.1 hypothetical protein L0Y99_10345 [Burkholderia cenocepacia]
MRRRKTLIALTLDNLVTALPPGRAYAIEGLSMMFAGSPAAIEEVAEVAVASGRLCASMKVRGFRRTYWVPQAPAPDVATRRTQPAESTGTLSYDLMSLARLAMTARRA